MKWFSQRLAAVLGILVALGSAAAFAQAPPPVPALPDAERRTSYSISGTTCACSVGFALYGSGTDVDSWIEVWVNGVRKLSSDSTFGWSLSSATGSLGTIARPITNAVLTFNAVQTATIQIVGAERPRRLSQFAENRGVAARDLNQAITDIFAQNRETWDKLNDVTGRALVGLPGESLTPLPAAATRAGGYLCFDPTGLIPTTCAPLTGTGNVAGPNTSTPNDFACWNNSTGTLLKDCGSTTIVVPLTLSTSLAYTRILDFTQSSPTGAGTRNSDFFYNNFQITDQANIVAPGSFSIGSNMLYTTGGTNSKGSKIGVFSHILHNSASTTGGDHIVFDGLCESSANDGGTNTGAGAAGSCFGINAGAHLDSGATNYGEIGNEFSVQIDSGGTAKWAFAVSALKIGTVSAAGLDAAYEIGATTTPFVNGIMLNSGHGAAPIGTTGCVICTDGVAETITTGIDLSAYTISGNFLKSNAFSVDGSGRITAARVNGYLFVTAATGVTFTIADLKTVTINNSLTFNGTDSTTMTFPAASDTMAGLGTAQTFTKQNVWDIATTVTSSAGANLDDLKIAAETTTITGTTLITKLAKLGIYRPTFTDGSAVTVSDAATVYIDNAPLAGGFVTLTRPWSLWAAAGNAMFGPVPVNGSNIGQINVNALTNPIVIQAAASVSNISLNTYYAGPVFFYETSDASFTNGNTLAIDFRGGHGNSYATVIAQITDQTAGAVKGKLVLGTANGSGAASQFVYIEPTGCLNVGTDSDCGANNLQVTGNLFLKNGANSAIGTFTCTSGGTITISNTNVAISDAIIISLQAVNAGTISTAPAVKTITAATGFTALCATSDTGIYNYAIIKNR